MVSRALTSQMFKNVFLFHLPILEKRLVRISWKAFIPHLDIKHRLFIGLIVEIQHAIHMPFIF